MYRTTKDILSHREAEVTSRILLGDSNNQAAEKLYVTEKTVKFHLTNIYKKLGVRSRSEMITKWYQGLLDPTVTELVHHFMPTFEKPELTVVGETAEPKPAPVQAQETKPVSYSEDQLPTGVAA